MPEQRRISIIDSEQMLRHALGGLVRPAGYDAGLYESAEQFLEAGAADASALLITDVQLPGMSGLDLQERLRRDGHRLPLIFLTALDDEALRKRAFAGGAKCFLIKPFEGDIMIRCIEFALSQEPQIY
ncbi:response regulator transcription factor [Massilia niastensis]|uniref:response regulator transcription factor n=1 Tax=Massilia niastensis TaxID=544911 RepID=UPI000361CDA8|nr:response regulator [Massilia niastensis]